MSRRPWLTPRKPLPLQLASAEAQHRAAEALEEANRRENLRDAKNIPWVVAGEGTSGERWRVTNNSGGRDSGSTAT